MARELVKAEYRVACGSQLETLNEEVNDWLQQGFVPVGSMVIEKVTPEVVWFYQPMLRPARLDDEC